jgi:hypothetical protein
MTRAEAVVDNDQGLYERDFQLWLEAQVAALRAGRLDQLDVTNLLEEVQDMARSQERAIESNLIVLLTHLLKYQYQPEQRSNSWHGSIVEHRRRVRRQLQESPSLGSFADRVFAECHADAREQAAAETGLPHATFPEACPYTLEEVLTSGFLPE